VETDTRGNTNNDNANRMLDRKAKGSPEGFKSDTPIPEGMRGSHIPEYH